MGEQLYDRFVGGRLNLREHLAAARSILANERTFLAYQRTAVTTFAAAASFIKFFNNPILEIIGWLLMPVSGITAVLGVVRYVRMRESIHSMEADCDAARQEGKGN
jgi:putative membrane protein